MQELNELKNLVIQSLESNGSLSNIRAQIRASVFKVIDQNDGNQKKESPYSWENQKCGAVLESPEGKLILMLIKEFLQFYKMEYSLSVFSSEATLREEINRENLGSECGLSSNDIKEKPLLWQIVADSLGGQDKRQQVEQVEKEAKQKLKEAQDLIKKNQQSLQQGVVGQMDVPTPQEEQDDQFNQEQEQQQNQRQNNQQEQNLAISGEYGSDQYEQYEQEEQVDEHIDAEEDNRKSQLKNDSQALQSSDVIGASQSQGFDMSVDSLALEDYDYYEDIQEQEDDLL